jgi:hypothetical protein
MPTRRGGGSGKNGRTWRRLFAAHDYIPLRVDAVDLKNRLARAARLL